MKYRKKPVVIEAHQWFPPGDERHDPNMLTVRKGNSVNPPDYRQLGDLYQFHDGFRSQIFFIHTLEGNMRVKPGDWIITGIAGEKYPCKPDIFEQTYEKVEE